MRAPAPSPRLRPPFRPPFRPARGERGHTLIEIMYASLLFLIGMAAVFALQNFVIHNNGLATDLSVASNLASSALERLRLERYDTVVGTSVCPAVPGQLHCEFDKHGAEVLPAVGYFTRTWEAQVDATNQITDLTVRVRWQFALMGMGILGTNHEVVMNGRIYPK